MAIVRKGNCLHGIVTVGNRRYVYFIDVSETSGYLSIDWRLNLLLGESLNNFIEQSVFKDPIEFHDHFCAFVHRGLCGVIKSEPWLKNPLSYLAFIKNLKDDIENSDACINNVDLQNRTVELKVKDYQLRDHKAVFKLGPNYPREPVEIISLDLPIEGGNGNNSDLRDICLIADFCKKFQHLVYTFQHFWDVVAVLDCQCHVLDPPKPTYKDISRRIKLTDTLSVALIFNPYIATQRPNIKLLGCMSDVNHFREILQKNLEDEIWDCNEDLVYNLSNLLEIELPCKEIGDETKEDFETEEECAICFTWRLNDEIPNEVCEKKTCKSMYHSKCLFTYLSSLPRNKVYFGKIQGECPNCDEVISCAVPKL